MAMLVLDASVIFDLERAGLVEVAFRLDEPYVTPDLLYRSELEDDVGPYLRGLGLQVLELNAEEVAAAQALAHGDRKLSNADCWALLCARRPNHRLLTGDARLRSYAEANAIACSGILWLLQRLLDRGVATPAALIDGLSRAVRHSRCRLPRREVDECLARWAALARLSP